jgi:hypothetical protein
MIKYLNLNINMTQQCQWLLIKNLSIQRKKNKFLLIKKLNFGIRVKLNN